jgi:PAS domain S-box-containing protein
MGIPLRVLLIEDSEDDALLNLRELKNAGYTPEWARVETAEEMSAALDEKPWEIVLADHNMPRFDALSALRLLMERGLDLPCIIVSGSIGEEQLLAALKEGAQDYVLKRDLSRLGSAVPRGLAAANERRERRRAELALRASEERYALAVLGSRDGIWDWDIRTGQAYRSARVQELLGVGERGDRFEPFWDLVLEEDRERGQRAMRDHLERRVPYEIEFRTRTPKGEVRWLCARGQALWDEDGKPIRMAGSLSDITARKQYEETLRQKVEIIERQQEAIRTLSTPIIEVWDGVLMMPVFGAVEGQRAEQMMEVLLNAVARTRCRYAIIDLTSVKAVDTHTANHIIRLVQAVQLIGAQGIVVGIRPEVAQIMVNIGADLQKITTMATLRDALVLCMKDQRRQSK